MNPKHPLEYIGFYLWKEPKDWPEAANDERYAPENKGTDRAAAEPPAIFECTTSSSPLVLQASRAEFD